MPVTLAVFEVFVVSSCCPALVASSTIIMFTSQNNAITARSQAVAALTGAWIYEILDE
jgi:hypothetical protein